MQGTVYCIPLSGLPVRGWLISQRHGPHWLSGGVFGAETSVIALLLLRCAFSLALLRLARRRGSLVPWRRQR